MRHSIHLRNLGLADYAQTFAAMRRFTQERNAQTPDELWLCEHPPVYTQGLAGKAEHVLATHAADIPIVQTDRGGQITYHGPGQILAYPLLDLRRLGYFVKEYVFRLEDAVLRTLADLGITGHRVSGAPGVYVHLAEPRGNAILKLNEAQLATAAVGKIAALGVKIHRHASYHGLALNVAMDLAPFTAINPCGYAGLKTVDLRSLGVTNTLPEVQDILAAHLVQRLAP